MTQKSIDVFINEISSEPSKTNYPTKKTDIDHIDNIWSLDILDLNDYGHETKRGHGYVLVVIDKFN